MSESNIYRNPGEEFEFYVERQFRLLFNRELENSRHIYIKLDTINDKITIIEERLDKMATLAEELGVEETTLSEVIPALATELTTLQTTLTSKEAAITEDNATLAADSTKLAENNAELAAIRSIKESLTPVVEKAKTLVPAPVVTPPAETPPVETPATPPAEQPVATEAPVTPEQPATPPAETQPEVPATPPAEG